MSDYETYRGPVYKAAFSATALTTGVTDLFCLTAPSNSRVVIREIVFGQYSDAGDAEAEILSVTVLAGSTAPSSGGAITAQNVERHSGAPTAGTSVVGPSTVVASTASADLLIADTANMAAGWLHRPDVIERIVLAPSERLAIKISAPNDAITANGTVTFQEIGKNP